MIPPDIAPTRAGSRRGQPGLPWTCIILVALAALPTSDLRAQEWRFDAIDQRFVDQQRATDWRFDHVDRRLQLQQHAIDWRYNNLDQQLQRLNKRLRDDRLSHQDIWRTQGLVSALRDIVRGLQQEAADLRRLIEPPQPSRPLPADMRRLPL